MSLRGHDLDLSGGQVQDRLGAANLIGMAPIDNGPIVELLTRLFST